jgi:hypothetical protein
MFLANDVLLSQRAKKTNRKIVGKSDEKRKPHKKTTTSSFANTGSDKGYGIRV